MHPAFHSTRAAAAFGLIMAMSIALPMILRTLGPPTREQAFSTLPTAAGPVAMIRNLIYQDSGQADVLFVGSSLIKTDVHAKQLAQRLSRELGRPMRVDVLELNWYGADQQYFMLKDYLAHHPPPNLVVLHTPQVRAYENRPHPQAYRWLRYGDLPELPQSFPTLSKLQLYGEMVLGAPRQLLSLLRPNLIGPEDPVLPAEIATGKAATSWRAAAGPSSAEATATPGHDATSPSSARSVATSRPAAASPATAMAAPALPTTGIAAPAPLAANRSSSNGAALSGMTTEAVPAASLLSPTDPVFQVVHPKLSSEYRFQMGPYTLFFMERMADLVRRAGSHLVLIHLPLGHDPVNGTIQELEPWATVFGPDIRVIAVPKDRFFEGLDPGPYYFSGDNHMTPAGGDRFTQSIASPVGQAYLAATAAAPAADQRTTPEPPRTTAAHSSQ